MSLSREQKRTIYYTYSEISESAKYAPALPIVGETVQCSKGETGHGPWLDASIDFFALTGGNRQTLDRLHLDSDVRGSYTGEHKRICREFWRQVKEKALCEYGLFVSELM